ncbi:MAG TPA: hypothetical protein VLB69_00930, partial [Rudaea sp.]|nr:hypothetical protein [Rudaea sp.]
SVTHCASLDRSLVNETSGIAGPAAQSSAKRHRKRGNAGQDRRAPPAATPSGGFRCRREPVPFGVLQEGKEPCAFSPRRRQIEDAAAVRARQ